MGNLVNAPIFFESQLSSIFTVFLIGMSFGGNSAIKAGRAVMLSTYM